MRVLLDEHPCETGATSVAEAIAGAAAVAEGRGRVVVEVVVDGTAWSTRDLDSAAHHGDAAEEVRLISADLRTLVGETLADASAALVQVDAHQRDAAALVQSDRRPEAMQRLGDALAIWRDVHEAVEQAGRALGLDLRAPDGDALPGGALMRLDEHLRALRAALVSEDPVGLADALMYDGPEVVTDWRELLEALRARAREGADADTEGEADG